MLAPPRKEILTSKAKKKKTKEPREEMIAIDDIVHC
jgi:hypothetical protein